MFILRNASSEFLFHSLISIIERNIMHQNLFYRVAVVNKLIMQNIASVIALLTVQPTLVLLHSIKFNEYQYLLKLTHSSILHSPRPFSFAVQVCLFFRRNSTHASLSLRSIQLNSLLSQFLFQLLLILQTLLGSYT